MLEFGKFIRPGQRLITACVQVGLVETLGKFSRVITPGLHFLIPCGTSPGLLDVFTHELAAAVCDRPNEKSTPRAAALESWNSLHDEWL